MLPGEVFQLQSSFWKAAVKQFTPIIWCLHSFPWLEYQHDIIFMKKWKVNS